MNISHVLIALLFVAGIAVALYGFSMDSRSSFDDGSFIWEGLTIFAGVAMMVAAFAWAGILYMLA